MWNRTECGLSRVLARPQVLEGQQAAGVQGHQQLVTLHDVQAEGPGAQDDPLGLAAQGEDHAVLVLGQEGQAGGGGGGGGRGVVGERERERERDSFNIPLESRTV